MKRIKKILNLNLLIAILLVIIAFYLARIDTRLRNIYSVGYLSSLDKNIQGPLIFPKDVQDYLKSFKNKTN